ncbi:hypothetical protein SUDANB15_05724 [Streptomyces sp. enrichment culture]
MRGGEATVRHQPAAGGVLSAPRLLLWPETEEAGDGDGTTGHVSVAVQVRRRPGRSSSR